MLVPPAGRLAGITAAVRLALFHGLREQPLPDDRINQPFYRRGKPKRSLTLALASGLHLCLTDSTSPSANNLAGTHMYVLRVCQPD